MNRIRKYMAIGTMIVSAGTAGFFGGRFTSKIDSISKYDVWPNEEAVRLHKPFEADEIFVRRKIFGTKPENHYFPIDETYSEMDPEGAEKHKEIVRRAEGFER